MRIRLRYVSIGTATFGPGEVLSITLRVMSWGNLNMKSPSASALKLDIAIRYLYFTAYLE